MTLFIRHLKAFVLATLFSLPAGLLGAYLDGPFTAKHAIAYTAYTLPLVWYATLLSARPDAKGWCARRMKAFLGTEA
jgi:ABC-type antimicrobial peptide transport system permease subunit